MNTNISLRSVLKFDQWYDALALRDQTVTSHVLQEVFQTKNLMKDIINNQVRNNITRQLKSKLEIL